MKIFNYIVISFICLRFSLLSGAELTVCSYNCGGLSDHYDYLRSACMEKLMQERYIAEPDQMALNEKIQKLALKILFSDDAQEKNVAKQLWDENGYDSIFEQLTTPPIENNSPSQVWYQKANKMITSYKVRPVVIEDEEVNLMLDEHIKDLTGESLLSSKRSILLQKVRAVMARRTFAHKLKYDIICLQEADYLSRPLFPKNYELLLADSLHSKNGIAWNKERFKWIKTIGDIQGRAFAVQLLDKESNKTVLIASGHITGCNPYKVQKDPETGVIDSAKGDSEIETIIDLFEKEESDFKILGLDSNVTPLHPRLQIIKEAEYQIDYENYLEPTCTSPYQILNNRIDFIAMKSNKKLEASILNIPVLDVGLNSIETNISDHKPIAAKVQFYTQGD